MTVRVNNITFNFRVAGSDAMDDTSNLGLGHLLMPGNMALRFKKECGWDNGKLLPHYAEEDMDLVGSEHECYNADTNIVLMNWLFGKRRKYNIDYYGIDPFWLFHDSLHANNDVHGYEVCCINSHVEKQRLLDGAEYAAKNGVHIMADSVIKIERDWKRRWWSESTPARLNTGEFFQHMVDDQRELADFIIQVGDLENYKTQNHYSIPSMY